ncbi:helix-turn-helix domain-containing protein [Methylophaga sp.]|uniref:AraC family transcriptional regulator n=1 Tax=Methylophaga sp. TaxID=2024840 RepID=UPI0027183C75|nr:helix-turn-helix domain-containing protein [Methylophaga sp.]MDO8826222.1 helix-turn-helix domain-containing protein [Methylophaga sp.]
MRPIDQNQVNQIQELVYLGYQRVVPDALLSPWIECYWMAQTQLQQLHQEKLYPDGGCSLLFHFKGNAEGCWFNALQKFGSIRFEAEVDSFGIRFKPGGANALLGLAMNELVQEEFAANDLKLKGLETLFEQLINADFQQRVKLTETWLLNQFTKQQPIYGPVQHLSHQLAVADNELVQTLNKMGITRRQAERYFHHQVGIPPNQLKLLLRIKAARLQLKLNPQQLLVDTALQCGYFDQAHFNHHFKKVTGYGPGEYRLKQQRRIINQEMIIN